MTSREFLEMKISAFWLDFCLIACLGDQLMKPAWRDSFLSNRWRANLNWLLFSDAIWCHVIWSTLVHIYASLNKAIVGSDNGLAPVRCQAIIWTNAGILLIRPQRIIFSEILIYIQTFSLNKMESKMSFAKGTMFSRLSMIINFFWFFFRRRNVNLHCTWHYALGTLKRPKCWWRRPRSTSTVVTHSTGAR